MAGEVTEDRFLGGRVVAAQPAHGFRAGHDTVLLAAAVPARAGDRVLELGSGAGIASLCVAARVGAVRITGVEIDRALVALANANAARNGMAKSVTFVDGDIRAHDFRGVAFGHVFFNPPFHPESGSVSPVAERDVAMRGADVLGWVERALDFVKATGTVTAILRADRLTEVEARASAVLPLVARAGDAPKRVIVQFRKTAGERPAMRAPFALHEADGRPTEEAERVLRHAAALVL